MDIKHMRLLPIYPDLSENIHYWLHLYQPILNSHEATFNIANKPVVISILKSALIAYCVDNHILTNDGFRINVHHYKHFTFEDFWFYMYSLNHVARIISCYIAPRKYTDWECEKEILEDSVTHGQIDVVNQFVSNNALRNNFILDCFQASYVLTDRLVWHYDNFVKDTYDIY